MTIYKLGGIATVEISGVDKKIKDGEIPVKLCNFVDVYYNWAITSDLEQKFMEATARANEIERFKLKRGQVALTKDSETRFDIGIATYIADDFDNVILGYHNALITPNPEKLSGKYLNALLHTDYARTYFANNASGSGQRYALSIDALNNFPVPLIPLAEQERIGDIFSSIDQKIALNRAINDNLEAMAKQLYDYWFVQFDFPNEEGKPYKSSGGKMVWDDKLKREIPDGWSDSTLSEICVMYQPQTIGTDLLLPNGVYRVYGANGIVGKYDQYNHEDSEIAMACRGNSCGVVNRTMPYSWITGNAMVLQMKDKGVSNEYIKQSVSYMNISGAISGSGQPQLTRENLNIVKCLKPAHNVLLGFSQLIEPIVTAQLHIIEENDKITKLRADLLQLLMNGQVSVNSD